MNIDDIFGNKTFTYESLKEEGEATVTIAGAELKVVVDRESGEEQERMILSFSDDKRKLWLNKNKRIALREAYGPETENWIGKQITCEADGSVSYQGRVGGVRVRIPRAAKMKKAVGDAPF